MFVGSPFNHTCSHPQPSCSNPENHRKSRDVNINICASISSITRPKTIGMSTNNFISNFKHILFFGCVFLCQGFEVYGLPLKISANYCESKGCNRICSFKASQETNRHFHVHIPLISGKKNQSSSFSARIPRVPFWKRPWTLAAPATMATLSEPRGTMENE